jgi:two-component system LytT family response regulator
MVNAVIIEDEIAAYTHLKTILETHFESQITVIGHQQSVAKGISLIEKLQPELLFLDIELLDGNGFEILDYFFESSFFEVIFTTGLRDYKEKAMDYFAFYYLNKPISKEQLNVVLTKFLNKRSAFNPKKYDLFKNQLDNKNSTIVLPSKNGDYTIVKVEDIIFCEADGSYTYIHTKDDKTYTSSNNLKKIEGILPKPIFFRIHRSSLLNLKHIVKYNNSGEIFLSNNKKLLVSSRNKTNFYKILKLLNYSI